MIAIPDDQKPTNPDPLVSDSEYDRLRFLIGASPGDFANRGHVELLENPDIRDAVSMGFVIGVSCFCDLDDRRWSVAQQLFEDMLSRFDPPGNSQMQNATDSK